VSCFSFSQADSVVVRIAAGAGVRIVAVVVERNAAVAVT